VLRPIPRWDSSQRSPDPLAGFREKGKGRRERSGRKQGREREKEMGRGRGRGKDDSWSLEALEGIDAPA